MNYSIMIAAAFILATIAVAALSPFDNLPKGAPQQTAAAAPESSGDDPSYDDTSSYGNSGSNIRGSWAPGEAPPP